MICGKQVTKYFKRCGLKKILENNTRKTSKKNIFEKCNFLIIVFFSKIAQAKTLEKFNVTCFPRG
jgi:hypothetical protein